MVIDGIMASCYASADHDLAHMVMMPVRLFPDTIKWIFGDENGFLFQIKIMEEVARWFLPYGQLFEASSESKSVKS